MSLDFIFSIIILIFSVVVHELSHGVASYMLGDNTAKYQGRLTLNPFKHLDLFGSFVLPALTYISGGFIIGWAKPVPYNPYNLKNQRWGEAIVAFAGPFSNFVIALFFSLLIRFNFIFSFVGFDFNQSLYVIFISIILTNLTLMVFNLFPIPPLDGSKILYSFFPNSLHHLRSKMESYGPMFLILFVFFLWEFVTPIVFILFKLLTGQA